MSTPTRQISTGLLKPQWFFFIAVILLGAGWGINYFFAREGILRLEAGKPKTLVTGGAANSDKQQVSNGLGFIITLDSLEILSHTPVHEIQLWKSDTMPANPHAPLGSGPKELVSTFPLEPMKINKIEDTDLRFRLKAFYPNFEFAYEYPARKDTIKPKAPGITLELKTKEGTPVVTLRSDQPNKNKLGDIVSLGAALVFYWELPADSLKQMSDDHEASGNKIVFAGADSKLYFLFNGTIAEKELKENLFYAMPDQDSVGFTILHCFPDAAMLKAVPSSKGTAILNPVAHVEIWKEGEGYRDAFIYPETRTRRSGGFDIPGSGYKIGMGTIKASSIKYCDCHISVQKDSTLAAESLSFASGKPQHRYGYRFTPLECSQDIPEVVTMQITRTPGKGMMIIGTVLAAIALLLLFIRGNIVSS